MMELVAGMTGGGASTAPAAVKSQIRDRLRSEDCRTIGGVRGGAAGGVVAERGDGAGVELGVGGIGDFGGGDGDHDGDGAQS